MKNEIIKREEHSAILAGLRLLQRLEGNLPSGIEDVATCGGDHDILDAEQIDELVERLNFAGPATLELAA